MAEFFKKFWDRVSEILNDFILSHERIEHSTNPKHLHCKFFVISFVSISNQTFFNL